MMAYPLKFAQNKIKAPSAKKLSPGDYTSKIVKIEDAPGFEANAAFKIFYKLCDSRGEEFEFTEVFIKSFKNPRTADFFEYLEDSGIKLDEDDLVGMKETLTLAFSVSEYTGRSFLNVVHRQRLEAGDDSNI